MKSNLAKLNINLSTQSLAWPTQWAKAKSANAASRQSIFLEYWWPDYADPYSWFINLLQTENPPYFNLSYYSNPALDKQINKVERLAATNPAAGEPAVPARCRSRSSSRRRSRPCTTSTTSTRCAPRSPGSSPNPAYPNVVFVYNLKPTGS